MSEKVSIDEVAKLLGVTKDTLRDISKKHLDYRKDYFVHAVDGLRYNVDAVEKLKALLHPNQDMYAASEDEVVAAKVANQLPPNPNFVWVYVPGFEGRGVCNVPRRLSQIYRVPGKRIWVRHVEGEVFQYADPR